MAENRKNDDSDKDKADKAKKPRPEPNPAEESITIRDLANAATDYGLEGRMANAQDPRVNALRLSEQNQAERRASQGSRRPSDAKKQPVTIPSQRESGATGAEEQVPANAAINYGLEDHKANQQDPRVEGIRHNQLKSRGNSDMALHRTHAPTSVPPSAPVTPPTLAATSKPTSNHALYGTVPRTSPPPVSSTAAAPSPASPRPTSLGAGENATSGPPPPARPQDVPMPPPTMYTPPRGETPPAVASSIPIGRPVEPAQTKTTEDQPDGCCSKLINTDVTFDPSKDFACKTTNTAPDTTGVLYSDLETDGSDSRDTPRTEMQTTQTTHLDLDDCFELAIRTVKQAGALTLEANKQRLEYTTKQHEHDLLTTTDNVVEHMIMAAIMRRYPDHKFICEEAVSQTETGQVELTNTPTWIIDPIDGTMNFVHHFPYYCISVALLVDKETEFGIVYNPPMKDCYSARRGMGAHLNGDPIVTSGQLKLEHAMILQEYSSGMNDTRNVVVMDNAKKLLKKTHAMRSIGSSAMGLAMIASGVADGFYYFGLHIWDMAAGNLLVTEAGGTVIDPNGGELDIMSRRCLAAATEPLARELAAELIQNYPSPRDDQPKSVNPNEYLPGGERKDFNAQTEFTDSSESLVTEESAKDDPNKKDTNPDKAKDKKNDDKENANSYDKKNDRDKDDMDNSRRSKRTLGSREANATLGPNFIQ
ncbi:uncharacterized protein Dwil_GK20398 [Drosophila willistoni]|uniref:inositol-phosphate phosphatase n=1 Tax=Drosophila willistoni TaxID=7260 RepID=B4N527_DROWI|nr:uncharacterized protein LOC6645774 [Drosophila willistoni]EDW79466.1 uncharacterized protein Dwil_GK20398 [Drosophila willistoni]